MRKRLLENINYIFYIPGSSGSLLSLLMKSQMEENFIFDGFIDDTAHNYDHDAIKNTHGYHDYIAYKKSGIGLREHLEENLHGESLTQRIVFPKWIGEFLQLEGLNLILCHMEDYSLKLLNFYKKLNGSPLAPPVDEDFNFKIDKSHKHSEAITYIKSLNWMIKLEKEYLHSVPTINIDNILKKDFNEFNKICKITNAPILDQIINEYNEKNLRDFNILPNSMKRYLKRYHNSI